MNKEVRLLDIGRCNICKHSRFATSGKIGYVLCKKDNRIVKEIEDYKPEISLPEINIPEWCSLPVVENEAKKGE